MPKESRPPKTTAPFDPAKLDGRVKAIPIGESSGLSPEAIAVLEEASRCATAVGNLCFAWSALEGKIDDLIAATLESPHEGIAETLLSIVDPRDKIKIALNFGHLRKISDEWFDVLKWCLNTTDGDLRARRNRFVHDRLHVSPEGMKRIRRKVGFNKAEYFTELRESASEAEVWALVEDIQRMVVRIDCLMAPTRRKDWKAELTKHNLMSKV